MKYKTLGIIGLILFIVTCFIAPFMLGGGITRLQFIIVLALAIISSSFMGLFMAANDPEGTGPR